VHNDAKKKVQQSENELKNAVQKAKDADKQLMQQKNELKRKYGLP